MKTTMKMAIILNIDTATQNASIAVSANGETLAMATNQLMQDHAGWIHQAIHHIMADQGLGLSQLDAVAITEGPGSYTGIRIGMATAKGLCYALDRPLIVENTLTVMAAAGSGSALVTSNPEMLLCPMIDARRMEVFMGIYDKNLNVLVSPANMILDVESFKQIIPGKPMLFFGSGAMKFSGIYDEPGAVFNQIDHSARDLAVLSERKFIQNDFADIAYSEPLYLKEFYTPQRK